MRYIKRYVCDFRIFMSVVLRFLYVQLSATLFFNYQGVFVFFFVLFMGIDLHCYKRMYLI